MTDYVLPRKIAAYYERGAEEHRLSSGAGLPELLRTQRILARTLPGPRARVLDVGGGPGVYAAWLARAGYSVQLLDPVELHVEQARQLAASQPEHPFRADVGDASRCRSTTPRRTRFCCWDRCITCRNDVIGSPPWSKRDESCATAES